MIQSIRQVCGQPTIVHLNLTDRLNFLVVGFLYQVTNLLASAHSVARVHFQNSWAMLWKCLDIVPLPGE